MINLEQVLPHKRCLAVDDLVEARAAIKKMLMILGVKEVDVATNGDEASQLIHHNDYDIVISDYNLGRGKDGQQVLEEARFTRKLKATATFIMLTGENALDMVMGALEYEPDDYITKPFNLTTVRKRLLRVLSIKEKLHGINHALDLRDHKETVNQCKLVLKSKTPFKMKVLRIMGAELIKLKQFKEALVIYDGILKERDVNWAFLGKAHCLRGLGQESRAMQELEECVDKFPLHVQSLDLMAKIKLSNKQSDAAQKILQSAVHVSPKAVLRQMELGRVAFNNKDMAVAEVAFRQAMKLGRHSCYRSIKNYMNFVKTLQPKILEGSNREIKDKSAEAFKAIEEIKSIYHDRVDALFEAENLESLTYKNLGNTQEAEYHANKAEELMGKFRPNISQKITLIETLLNTDQHGKAQGLIGEVHQDKDITSQEMKRLKQAMDSIDPKYVRQYTTALNDEAIRYYERGQLVEAIKLFDKATAYDEAGISVLLNAVQCKVAYMDQKAANKGLVDHCLELFQRIGELPRSDERYERYNKLRKTCQRLKRAV